MLSDSLIVQARNGMKVISADGVVIGHVKRVHFRDTEGYLEVHQRSLLNAFLDIFTLREEQPPWTRLFLHKDSIARIEGKRLELTLDAHAARASKSRPPWIEPDERQWT